MTLSSVRKLGGVRAWMIWLLASMFAIYKFTTQTSYASLNSSVAETLSLSFKQIGVLGSMYTFAFALMTIFSGPLLDRYGARKTLSIAAGMVAAGAFLFSIATTWLMIIFGQILMGLGGAFGYPGKGYLIRHWFVVGYFGIMFGLSQTLVTLSTALTQGSIGYLLLRFDWREIMLYGAGMGIIFLVAIAFVIRDPDEILERHTVSSRNFWQDIYTAIMEIVVNKHVWSWAILGSIIFGTIISINVFWGIKLLVAKGFEQTTAGAVNSSMWFGYAVGGPCIVMITNRLKSFKLSFGTCTAGLLLMIIALLSLPSLSLTLAYTLFVFIGFFGAAAIISFIVTTKVCRDVVTGTSIGLVNATMFFMGGVFIWLPTQFADKLELDLSNTINGMLIFPIALVISIISLIFVKETFSRNNVTMTEI